MASHAPLRAPPPAEEPCRKPSRQPGGSEDAREPRRLPIDDEGGNAALVTVLAMAITLVVFMAAANLIVDSYGKGVIRTAVDEAARAGSVQEAPGGAIAACQAEAAQVMTNLLHGPFGRNITISCGLQGDQIVAVGDGILPAWLKVVPDATVHVTGAATLERNPTP